MPALSMDREFKGYLLNSGSWGSVNKYDIPGIAYLYFRSTEKISSGFCNP